MVDRPNIALVSWDSVRADHTPFHGYDRDTCPYLSRLADQSLVFEDTQVSAVGTPASFHGVFGGDHTSGSMENVTPDHWRETVESDRLLPEVLQDHDYHTGAFHYNALMSSAFGWDQGWDVYEDHMWDEKGEQSPSDDHEDDLKSRVYDLLQRHGMANFAMHLKKMALGEKPSNWGLMWDGIKDFIETAPEPWFLWILLIDTHHPYYAPPESQVWDQPGVRATYAYNYTMRRHRNLVGERRQSIVNAYDNTIRHADRFLRQFHEKLQAEGHGDAPLIVHSDHGDEFGEHGNYGHRPLMYDTLTRVPLVIHGLEERGRRPGPHSLLDLGNAVLEIAEINERLGQGQSLLSDNRDIVTVQNILNYETGRTVAAVSQNWKVLFHPEGSWGHGMDFNGGSWEAYDRSVDPGESNNRWGEHPEELENRLREQLSSGSRTATEEGTLEESTEERLRELGYIE